ncbi:CfaE/CblD family pilus tip adhesin [Serratia fonticola]|uniref:CfaE/CblD family pilus tip adhesin n=1 Tax=Serratia fonticola TaxID=47917 RepID=UPI00217B3CF1|nr:CfaE/CblD family pilus tip adhesin [Serratia fonticola]CAI1544488.1 Colonization factor antigen I subunit E [Serratia fonticola]
MLLKIISGFKFIIAGAINPFNLCVLLGGLSMQAYGASIAPQAQDTKVNITFDRMSLPANIYIWERVFGGSTDSGECSNASNCKDKDVINSLMCYSTTDPTNGACPVKLFWANNINSDNSKTLKLRFTHSSGKTKDLRVTSVKGSGDYSSWVAGAQLYSSGFSTYIPASELNKLSDVGVWRAELKMQVKAWDYCGNDIIGCPGFHRANWKANIILKVTDYGNHQIYLPAFPTSAPSVNLNLNTRPGIGAGNSVSGSTGLDMCLYDGNDSASNRISLLLQDEGDAAPDRIKGQFSVYRSGGDKAKASDRLDYQISVINPTTGAVQNIANGKEIVWIDTNRRDIQRPVMLPGGVAPALCVPAPLTLTTPAFSMADKTGGDYTGKLRIIYTPTTQTAP